MSEETPRVPTTISRRTFIEGLGFATGGAAVGIAIGMGVPCRGARQGRHRSPRTACA